MQRLAAIERKIRVTIVILLAGILLGGLWVQPASAQSPAADEELALRHAPIVYLKELPTECSTDGEQYLPAPVEAVLGSEGLTLREIAAEGTPSDPVVIEQPVATDLAGLGDQHYLDMPGNSKQPDCDYEEWFDQQMEEKGLPLAIYARVATEEGIEDTIVLQYWFYWVFNQFNNLHESDWEMVQLIFNASDATEALTLDPAEIAFAQHGGGERANWDDKKLSREGDRIVVFPASGSHASYYQDALWLGWGQNGSGFGCDNIREPLVRAEPQIIMMPSDPDPDGEFAWLLYEGRWGQRQDWEFNGPLGPNAGGKWDTPVSWTDGIRENSLAVPGRSAIGTAPTDFFCAISHVGGAAMAVLPFDPIVIGISTTAIVIAILLLAFFGWRYLVEAIPLYARNIGIFLPLSILLVAVALAGNALEDLLQQTSLTSTILGWIESSSLVSTIFGIGFGSIQQLLLFSLVAPAIIHSTYDIIREDHVDARESAGVALQRFPRTLGAITLNTLLTLLMVMSIILIPLAIYRTIQWLYTPHAVMIQDADLGEARHVSKTVVKKHWIRTLGMALLIAMVSGLPGPILGVIAIILGGLSMNMADIISSLTYAIAYPIAIIASTLYYLTLGGFDEEIDERLDGEESGATITPAVEGSMA